MKRSGNLSFSKFCVLALMFLSYGDVYVIGAPKGGHVVSGTASFTQDGNLTVITAGNRSIINYGSFNIASNETVRFVQPGAHATVLNRVTDPNPTNIFGQLQANGIVVIANPYGVFFQNGAVISVGGLYAGSGKISDADFTAGRIHFTDLAGDVRNDGVIAADNRIALMGANVVNTGTVSAAHGVAMMVSGKDVYVGEKNGNIFVQANGASLAAGASSGSVNNSGKVMAPRVVMGAGDMYSTAIVNSGLLQGRQVAVNAGRNGTATVGGKIDASSASNPSATGKGGSVQVLGGQVALQGAAIDASGANGGGSVSVGGNRDGSLSASRQTTVDAATTINADATSGSAKGGTVSLWSDTRTNYSGEISASGGAAAGDGGQVAVGSAGSIGYLGKVDGNTSSGAPVTLAAFADDIRIVPDAGAPAAVTGTTDISQTALITFFATNTVLESNKDIQVYNQGSGAAAGTLTLTSATTNTFGFQADTGSFVMRNLADTISASGSGISITAAGPGVGINASETATSAAAIAVGNLTTASTLLAGGAVSLNLSAATAAPVRIGSIDTSSANGAAGSILIGGSNLSGNITTGVGGNNGRLTAQATGVGGVGAATGAGGAITLNTSGAITLGGAVNTSSSGAGGGAINITGGGAVSTGNLTATSAVSTTTLVGSVTAATTGTLEVNKADTSSASGPGGAIVLGKTGTLPSSIIVDTTLTAQANGTGGAGGTVGAGGAMTLNSSGAITLTGVADASSKGAGGGAISLTGGGNVKTIDLLASSVVSTATLVGSVSAATTGTLEVGTVNTSSAAGPGGTITLGTTATLPTTVTADTTLTSSGTTTGGNIQITGSGAIGLTGAVSTAASAGTGGAITVNGGAFNGTTLTSTGTTGGGAVSLTAAGTLTLTGLVNTSTTNGTGGAVRLLSNAAADATSTDISTKAITTTSTNGTGGKITISKADTSNFFPTNVTVGGLLTTTGGSAATSGDIIINAKTASGAVNFSTDPLVLTGNTTISGSTSNVTTFMTKGFDLSLSLLGEAINATSILDTAHNLTLAGSVVNLNKPTLTTTGSQTFNSAVVLLNNNVTLVSSGSGNVTFNGTVNSDAAATPRTLTINTLGNEVFNMAVGTTPLGNLTTDSDAMIGVNGQTQFNAAVNVTGAVLINDTAVFQAAGSNATTPTVTTTGAQTYALGGSTVAADTYLKSSGNGTISLKSVDSSTGTNFALTLDTGGTASLNGLVGNTQALGALTIPNGTAVINTTSVKTAGEQNYGAAVSVAANTVLTGQGTTANSGVAVRFGSTVNSSAAAGGPFSLTLSNTASGVMNVGSDTIFAGVVGGTSGGGVALASLNTSTVGTTQINGTSVTTSGTDGQVYNGATTLGATTLLSAGAGPVNFKSTSTLGSATTPQALTITTTGTTTFSTQVGGVPTTTNGVTTAVTAAPALASLSVTSGPVSLSGGVTTVTGAGGTQTYAGQVTLTGDTILTGNTVVFTTGFLAGGGHNLTLNLAGTVTVDGASAAGVYRNLGAFTANVVSGGNSVVLLDTDFTTAGTQTYNTPVQLGGNTATVRTLNAGATGAIVFNSSLNSATTTPVGLSVANGAASSVTFNGGVGQGTTPLASLTIGAPTIIGGTLTDSGKITTTGAQSYQGLTLNTTAALATGASGSVGVASLTGGTNGLTVTTPSSSFGQIISGGALNFNVSGTATFTGNIGNTASLTLANTAGTAAFGTSASSIATTGFQTYNGAVTAAAATTTFSNSATGDITFGKTLDGGVNVVVNSVNNEVFNGQVGSAATPLISLTTDSVTASGQAQFTINVGVTGKAGVTTSGAVNIKDAVLFNVTGTTPVAVQSAGAQTYSGVATLGQSTTLANTGTGAAGSVTFSNTLDATTDNGQSLTVNTAGLTSFKGAVGTGHALNKLTTDNQGATDLGTLFNFAVPTGLTAGVGGVNALALAINDPVTFQITGATSASGPGGTTNHPSVAAASQSYAAITLQADTVLRGTTLSFTSINGSPSTTAFSLTLDFTNVALTLPATITGINDLAIIGAASLNGTVTTKGSQYYGGAVTLTGPTTLTSGMNGVTTDPNTITFVSTLNGPFALTLNPMTGGSAIFGGLVGNSSPLASLTVNGPTSITGGGMISTTGKQDYEGTLAFSVPTTLSAGTGNVTVTGATTGNNSLTVNAGSANFAGINTSGALAFNTGTGNVTVTGLTTGVSSLMVNAGSSNFAAINASGPITFNDGAGNATVTGTTTGTSSLSVTAGSSNFAGISVSGPITFNDSGNATVTGTTSGSALTVTAGSSNFAGIGVSGAIIFNLGTGLATFNNDISGASFMRNGTGTTSFGGSTITTSLGQSFGGPLLLTAAAATLTDGTSITFSGTVGGNSALTVNSPSTIFSNTVGGGGNPLKSLVTDAAGTTQINGSGVTTQGLQTYNDKVTLGAATVTLTSTNTNADGGAITFINTLDGAAVLNVNTPGNEIFKGLVGNGTALLGLNTDTVAGSVGGQAQFLMDVTAFAGKAGVNVAGNVTINDQAVFNVVGNSTAKIPVSLLSPVGTNTPAIRTTGTQTYNGTTATLLNGDTVLQGTTISLVNGVNGSATPHGLTLDFTGTQLFALANFTNLNYFAFVGGGTTQLGGVLPATSSFLYFANPVALNSATTLNSTAGNVVFDGTLNGPSALTINTPGDEIFNNLVGNMSAPASLTIDTVASHLGSTRFNANLTTLGATVGVQIGAGGLTVNDLVVFNVAGVASTTPTQVSVQSTGGQTYNGDATLSQNTVLTSTASGNLVFAGKVDGTFNFTLNSAGNEQFGGQVGGTNPLLSLTTDADHQGGSTIFNVTGLAAGVPAVTTVNNGATLATATGTQTYNDAVRLGTNTILLSSFTGPAPTGGAVFFNSTVDTLDTAPTLESLTVLAGAGQTVFKPTIGITANQLILGGAQVVFAKSIGSNRSLNLLQIGNTNVPVGTTPSVDLNNGVTVFTSLGQTYNDALLLSADTTLNDTGSSDLVFTGTVNGDASVQHSLTLNTAGRVIFGGLVGNITPLSLLSSTTLGGTQFNMDASTAPANHGGVTVGAGGVLISGPVSFNVAGVALGNGTRPSVQSVGAQAYNGAATLQRDTLLLGTGTANITFGNTVNSALNTAFSLAVNTQGNEVFGGLVGNVTPLTSLLTDNLFTTATGQTQFNMNVTGQTAGIAGVRVGAGGLLVNDNVAFNVTGSSVANPTVLVFGNGTQTYQLAADVQKDAVLIGDAGATAPTTAYTGGGKITFSGAVGSSTAIPANLTIRTGVGPTVFSDTVSVNALDVTGANVAFVGKVGPLGTLLISPNGGATTGPININGAGNSVTTIAGQTYRSPVVLGTNALLANSGTGDIRFNGTVDADGVTARTLTLASSGQVIFGGLVGNTTQLYTLTSTAAGTQFNMDAGTALAGNAGVNVGAGGVTINGPTIFNVANSTLTTLSHPSVQSVGSQTYNGASTLSLDTALTSSKGADITFNGALDGGQNLVLNTAGNEVFFGLVGNATPLTSLLVDNLVTSTGQTQFNMNAATAAAGKAGVVVGPGGVTINDTVRFNVANSDATHASVLTLGSGAQLYKAAATLGANTFLSSSTGTITFQSRVDGAFNLVLNTGGNATFGDLVGSSAAPTSLVSTAKLTQFNADLTGKATGVAGVNVGAGGLTVNGAVNFNVAGASLTDLTHPAVQSVGAQVYNGSAVLSRDTSLSGTAGADITFASTLDGAHSLTVDTAGNQIFNGLIGNSNPLIGLALDTLIAVSGGQSQFNMNAASVAAGHGGVTVGAGGLTINDIAVFTVGNSTSTKPSVQTLDGGAQTYNGPARLAADTVLRAAAGANIVFNSALNGVFNLLTNTNGTTRFNGVVGGNNALASLTANGNGQTIIAGGAITTTNNGTAAVNGSQTYNEAVVLTNGTTLASLGAPGGDITFNQSVSGGVTLTVNTSGSTIFNGPVGTGVQGPLAALTTDAPGKTQFNLDLTVPGSSAYPAAVVVNGPVTIGDPVVFNVLGGSLTQPTVLTLGDGSQSYNGLVTLNTSTVLVSATALPAAGASFSGGGLISFGTAGVTSGGGQNLFVRTAVGTTVLGSTINVGTLDLGGALATFNGPINLPGGLLSVEPNGGGTGGSIQFNGGGLTTSGAQQYNVGVILGANTVFSSLNTVGDGGAILFASTVDSDATPRALTLNTSGDEIFDGIVGGKAALLSLTTDAPGPVGGTARFNMDLTGVATGVAGVNVLNALTINDAVSFNVAGSSLDSFDNHPSIRTGGSQTYNGVATLARDTTLVNNGTGNITFNNTLDGSFGLALSTSGNEAFNGIIGSAAALASLRTGAGGQTQFNMNVAGAPAGVAGVNVAGNVGIGNAVLFNVAGTTLAGGQHASLLAGGTQTYTGAATLAQDTLLGSGSGGSVTFSNTVDGAFGLALSTSGDMVFNGIVGNTAAPVSLTTGNGTTRFNMNLAVAGSAVAGVRVNGPVTINGPVSFNVLGSTSNRPTIQTVGGAAQTYNGAATLAQNTVLAGATNGAVIFNTTVDGASALAVNTNGLTTFGGAVGSGTALVSLTTDAGGTTQINGGSVRTTGFQTYNDTATLASASGVVTLSSANTANDGGAITFGGLLDGAVALTLNTSGLTTFLGVVGGNAPLASITTDLGGTTQINGGALTTSGFQTYGDSVTLASGSGATALTSLNPAGGAITFAGLLDGNVAVTINTGATITFGGTVGGSDALASLTTSNAGGLLQFNGGQLTTLGFQTYSGSATLGVGTTLVSTNGGNLTFNGTVNGGKSLAFKTTGRVVLGDVVGGTNPLLRLTTSAGSTTLFMNGNVTTTDLQSYGGVALLRADTTLRSTAGGVITLNAVDGKQTLLLDTRGDMIFAGVIGGSTALDSVTTTGAGRTVFQGGSLTTSGAQNYGRPSQGRSGAAFLNADTTLASTNGAITFNGTLDGARALTMTTSGQITFKDTLGGGTPLGSLSTNGAGTTLFQGGGVTTSGLQSYNNLAELGVDTTLVSTGTGGIVFNRTLDGAQALTITSNSGLAFNDNVGDNRPMTSLFVTGNTDVRGTRVTTNGLMRFNGNVAAPNGALKLQSYRLLVQGDMETLGDLDLETRQDPNATAKPALIYLTGTRYVSDAGNVFFNQTSTAPVLDNVGTVVFNNAGNVTIQGGNFRMGNLQKIYSQGSLTINVGRGTATVGDIAARFNLTINAGTISLLGRTRGTIVGTRPNDGLNFVAGQAINFGRARIIFDPSSTDRTASFITTGGNTTIQRVTGISLFKDQSVDTQFRSFTPLGADNFLLVDNPIQPVGGGSQTLDTAAALSGALPEQKPVDVAADITITSSQLEELKKLGIHPRKAEKTERAALASKRALFAQLVDGQDTTNYGRLQPIGAGVSQLVPSDFVVVVDRMGEREVSSILKAFEDTYGKNKEKAPQIGEAFQTAFNDYTVEKQTADPAGFSPYLQSNAGKYPAVNTAVRNFDGLFGYIEHLGLTDKEVAKSEAHIVSDLGVSGLSAEEMVKVIKDLRKKLPAEQKAPSTKLPPSAPASAPAPGASAPATTPAGPGSAPAPSPAPAKKADAPPKTAREEAAPSNVAPSTAHAPLKKDSTRKSARQLKKTKEEYQHEVAGL